MKINLKGSASELYKLVLKDGPYMQKLSGTVVCFPYNSSFKLNVVFAIFVIYLGLAWVFKTSNQTSLIINMDV